MDAQKYLDFIKKELEKLPKKKMSQKELEFVGRYLGSSKKYLGAKTGDLVKIARGIDKDQGSISAKDLIKILTSLFSASTFEEHAIGGKIFSLLKPEVRAKIPFSILEKWLAKCRGWVEIDVICQSTFTGQDVFDRWTEWEKTIKKFSESSNISLRRASLVLQCKPARELEDKRFRKLAFETIEKLKLEKEILITKAVSWLLRSLTFKDKQEVKAYIIKNESTLPRIAFRETMKKIETGNKNGKNYEKISKRTR